MKYLTALPVCLFLSASVLSGACGGSTGEAKDNKDAEPEDSGDVDDSDSDETSADGTDEGDGGDDDGASGGSSSSGEACVTEACEGHCSAGTCGGQWTCTQTAVCTRDLVEYCGCDGQTIQASSTCVPFGYAHEGPCEEPGTSEGKNCDPSAVMTDGPTPVCEHGFIPEVVGGTYGSCIPMGDCACENHSDCTDDYACHNNTGRCGDWLR